MLVENCTQHRLRGQTHVVQRAFAPSQKVKQVLKQRSDSTEQKQNGSGDKNVETSF
jgi:hypothetical protein